MDLVRRATAICLAAILTAQFGVMSADAQQTAPAQEPATQTPAAPASPTTATPPLRSAPTEPQSTAAPQSAPGDTTTQAPNGGPPADTSKAAPASQQNATPQPPVGTAAAPYEKGVGVAASRPAGVVIAPAKQRRTRSFLIKVGLILGAAAAVGTVVGLSSASPSRQPH